MDVYFVTTLGGKTADRGFKRDRTPGFFLTMEDARRVVFENIGDIYEVGYYSHAVIEKVGPGVYDFPREEHWFEAVPVFDKDGCVENYKVSEIPKPEEFKGIVGWSIG